jgi:hypothetical protein
MINKDELVNEKIMTDIRNGDMANKDLADVEALEAFDKCDHQCSSNCRRVGCENAGEYNRCYCGTEFHIPREHKQEVYALIGYAFKNGLIGEEAEDWDWDKKEDYFNKCQAQDLKKD